MYYDFRMYRDVLRTRGWLSLQPLFVQDTILAHGRERRFSAGEVVFAVGDPPGGCYAIVSGQFAITIAPNANGPNLAHLAGTGRWYGEGGFFTRGPRRVGLQAVVESSLFHLPLTAMDQLAAEDAEWCRRFGMILMENLDLTLHVIDDLLLEDHSRRIAAVLARCLGEDEAGTLTIAQAELGRLSNVSRKVVNRILGEFAEKGWIAQRYGKIDVIDAHALRLHSQD